MKKSLLLLILIFTGLMSKAQEATDKNKIDTSENIEGTYQIQVINSRNQPLIPVNLKELVLKNRDATKIIYIPFGTDVRIKVMSTSEINKTGFKPLEPIANIFE